MTSTQRVLVAEPLADSGLDAMRAAGLEVDVKTGLTPDELGTEPVVHSLEVNAHRENTTDGSEVIHA